MAAHLSILSEDLARHAQVSKYLFLLSFTFIKRQTHNSTLWFGTECGAADSFYGIKVTNIYLTISILSLQTLATISDWSLEQVQVQQQSERVFLMLKHPTVYL